MSVCLSVSLFLLACLLACLCLPFCSCLTICLSVCPFWLCQSHGAVSFPGGKAPTAQCYWGISPRRTRLQRVSCFSFSFQFVDLYVLPTHNFVVTLNKIDQNITILLLLQGTETWHCTGKPSNNSKWYVQCHLKLSQHKFFDWSNMCVQMYPWQRLHSQKFQMISKLLEGRGGWRSFLVAKRKIELRYWCGETEGILSSSLIPPKIYNSTVSFFFIVCVCADVLWPQHRCWEYTSWAHKTAGRPHCPRGGGQKTNVGDGT